MPSDAYREGLRAKSYDDNPHEVGSKDHEDFYAGFTQRIRRGYTPPGQHNIAWGHLESRDNSLAGSRFVNHDTAPKENTYAKAKGK